MTNEEIKAECESIYSQKVSLQLRLEEIRNNCKHEHTFVGNWSYRIGQFEKANLCLYCGNYVSSL